MDASLDEADFHTVALHEIGHTLGFWHLEDVAEGKADLGETAHVDEHSIMPRKFTTGSGTKKSLSSGDKKALINVYHKRPEAMDTVAKVSGSVHIYGVDYEIFDNDLINEDRWVNIYAGAQEEYSYTLLETFKWGGECRVEVDIV